MQNALVLCVFNLCMVLMLMAPAAVSAFTWKINPEHSSIQFQVRYMGLVNVKGSFDKFQGEVALNEKNPSKSAVEVAIESASINTGVEKRDEHLRTEDFFDCPKYPTIRFVSKKVMPAGKRKLKVIGDLTMLGKTKEVVLLVNGPTPEIRDPWGNLRRGATARTRVNRHDFGMTWNRALDTGGIMISKTVDVIMEVELIKTAEKQPSQNGSKGETSS
jgi:polyisoprenoid-binding protein YceI